MSIFENEDILIEIMKNINYNTFISLCCVNKICNIRCKLFSYNFDKYIKIIQNCVIGFLKKTRFIKSLCKTQHNVSKIIILIRKDFYNIPERYRNKGGDVCTLINNIYKSHASSAYDETFFGTLNVPLIEFFDICIDFIW